MAAKTRPKITYEAVKTISPIYTGGEVSSNANGTLLATTVDGDVLVVDTKSARSLVQIEGDGETVTSLCLSPTAGHIVICSRSLSMRIYSLSTRADVLHAELLRSLKPHASPVISTTIDPTGSLLVTGGADGIAKVWDVRGGYCSHTFHGHGGLVTALEVFELKNATIAKTASKSRKRKSANEPNVVDTKDTSGTTMILASGGEDGKIKIWNLNTRQNVATLDSHVSVVRSIQYSPQQSALLSASRDRTIVIWNTTSWDPLRIIPAVETLEAAGFVLDGRFCYSGGEHGRLRLWNTETGQETTLRQQEGLDTEAVVDVVKVIAEDALLTVHQDQTLVLHSYKGLDSLSSNKTIPPLPILRRISGNHDEIIDMALVGPDRSKLALATNTESIKIISVQADGGTMSSASFGSDEALLEGHQDIVICLDVDWSGHWLATGAKDNTARLWRLDPSTSTYQYFASFSGHAESIGAIGLPSAPQPGTPAARDPLHHPPSFLITGSQDKTIKRWDTSKLVIRNELMDPYEVAKAVYTRVAHEKDINAIEVSTTASIFASASQDRTIKIWSTDDGSVAGILRGHKRGVWSVSFSPPGISPISLAEGGNSSGRGFLVSGSGDRTVKVWSLSTYTCLLTFEGHSNSVLKVIWLPPPGLDQEIEGSNRSHVDKNQHIIASASSDTLVKLWTPFASPDSDHLLATLDNHTDRVWSLVAAGSVWSTAKPLLRSPYSLISGAADASLTFWRDTTMQTALAVSARQTERVEQDQLLQNYIHARNYRESITLALTLNHPGRLLKILSDVANLPETEKEMDSIMGVKAVDEVLGTLGGEELYRLLERVRDWNTNARTAVVAQRVLNVLFKSYPASTWSNMAKKQRQFVSSTGTMTDDQSGTIDKSRTKVMSMKELFRALEVYTERHYKRMEELIDESYLLEYTLREMDEIAGSTVVATKANGDLVSLMNGDHDGDTNMT